MQSKIMELQFLKIEENLEYREVIKNVINRCFEVELLINTNLYVNIILTNNDNIKKLNKDFRNVDKPTDVLSFPMFEKDEINKLIKSETKNYDILGDIVISIEKVLEQSKEFETGLKRELSYMVVHGFYHLLGYDHMIEEEKKIMREKEENILK